MPAGLVLRAIALASAAVLVALGAAACGGSGGGGPAAKSTSATDSASGLTVTVAGDQVTLRRSKTSAAGKGGTAGRVACTDNYKQLVKATAEPAPTQPWYAATLITWPAANASSTATLSHALQGDPDLCVAQTSDQSTQVVIYFRPSVKTEIQKTQQAAQAAGALQAAAQVAVSAKSKAAFPAAADLVKALSAQGFYTKQTADVSGVKEAGTLYLLTSRTTTKQVVFAVKDTSGAVKLVTQGLTGTGKVTTAKTP